MGRDATATLAAGGGGAVCRLTKLGSWLNMIRADDGAASASRSMRRLG